MIEMNENPLVSVVVVTYNSEKFIIETLESIKSQTYNAIELIVSDDCSRDNTIEVCNQWIALNSSRFVRTVVTPTEINGGVAHNLNHGIDSCTGDWIKAIAGDDLLVPTAIEEFVTFVVDNPNCRICTSTLSVFGGNPNQMDKQEKFLDQKYSVFRNGNSKEQYKTSLKRQILPGPGLFMQKSLWREVGGYNETYPMAEEYPFELRVLRNNRVFLLDKKLIKWRQRDDSLSHLTNSPSNKQLLDFYWDVRRKLLIENHLYLWVWDQDLIAKQLRSQMWYYKALRCISPLTIARVLKKIIGR